MHFYAGVNNYTDLIKGNIGTEYFYRVTSVVINSRSTDYSMSKSIFVRCTVTDPDTG